MDDQKTPSAIMILSESEFELEKDVRALELPDLLVKYPALAKKADVALKQFTKSLEGSNPGPGTRYGVPEVKISPGTGELHRIVHVGSDYVMVESIASEPERVAVKAAAITKLSWYRGPMLATQVHHIRDSKSGATTRAHSQE